VRFDCGNISWREKTEREGGRERERERERGVMRRIIWMSAKTRGGRIGGLGSIVASRRYYLPYTRCLCRLAGSVDSRLKSRIHSYMRSIFHSLSLSLPRPLCHRLSLALSSLPRPSSLSRGARSAVIAATTTCGPATRSRARRIGRARTGLSIYRSRARRTFIRNR